MIRYKEYKDEKTYIRDGRAPIPEKESTSRVMSANKAKNTSPEIFFRKALWSNGIKGYRLHWKKAPGRPDIAFPSKKIAIFVNFWEEKFRKNKNRDIKKEKDLKKEGWKVFTVWECEIKDLAVIKQKINELKRNLNR